MEKSVSDCSSLIVSEETGDYIIEYNSLYFDRISQLDNVCLKCVNDTWCILYSDYPGSRDIDIRQGYYSIPKLYGLMDTTSFESSGITATLNQPFLNVRGQEVLIGFLDTGERVIIMPCCMKQFKIKGFRKIHF